MPVMESLMIALRIIDFDDSFVTDVFYRGIIWPLEAVSSPG